MSHFFEIRRMETCVNLPDPTILENYIKSHADTYSNGDGMEYRLEDAIGKPTGEDNGEVNGGDKSQTDRALAICIRKVRFEGKQ